MKFKILRDNLLEGIQAIHGAVTTKATLPILSHVLIDAKQDVLKLTTTDLDIGLTCVIDGEIIESGSITVPVKRFSDIIKELTEKEINVTVKKNNLVFIETNTCQFKLMGLSSDEFPKLPEFKDKEVIKLQQEDLKKMLSLTSFAVSFDETRYILNGILFKIKNNILTAVATDGRRLAIISKKIDSPPNKELHIIIPIKAIHELNRNLKEEGKLSFVLGANQAMFELDKMTLISRLIEGEFPDYQQVIPEASSSKIKVNRQLLLSAVRRAALLSTVDYQAVKLEIFKKKMVISKNTPDIGESREELAIDYSGKELIIGFNPNYLIDVLKNIEEETVELEVSESEKPAVLRQENYIYIVLPMRLS